jgi:uncharacterized protein (DUF934 family)
VAKEMILDQRVGPCPYRIVGEEDVPTHDPTEASPLAQWLEWIAATSDGQTGVILEPGDSADALASHLERASFIALSFPKFTDGRAYSHARRLRKNYGYTGIILSFGDVLRDQLMHMHRCGINGFILREDQDLAGALEVFERFPTYYQKSDLIP